MTKACERFFAALRIMGFVGLALLLVRVEWSFVHGDFSNFFNPLVQLFVFGSMLLVPHFYIVFSAIVAGYIGGRIVKKRLSKESTTLAPEREVL